MVQTTVRPWLANNCNSFMVSNELELSRPLQKNLKLAYVRFNLFNSFYYLRGWLI